MTFRWPLALWLLAVIPVALIAGLAFARRRRARSSVTFSNLEVLRAAAPRSSRWPQRLAAALVLAAAIAMAVGLARPQAEMLVPRRDATVILVMDHSDSMTAQDVAPSRLDAAVEAARTFLRTVPGRTRVGMVVFGSKARTAAWPTTVRGPVERALERLEPNGATAIGDALLEAIRITNDSGGASLDGRTQRTGTAVVLLSDGENNAGQTEPLEAARVARERGIRVYTVALGGGRAPASSPLGIVQPVDRVTLARIARRTGGTAFSSATPERLASIYQALGSKLGLVRRDVEVTHVAAGVAAVLLLGATMASFARRPALP